MKIKVLQVLDYIDFNSGVSSVVMNYYYHIPDNVEFDFLLYDINNNSLEEDILARGNQIYVTGKPSGINIMNYYKCVDLFFQQHAQDYDIIHLHIPNAAFIIMKCARKYGISTRIIHSHNAKGADNILKKMRNFLLNRIGIRYANRYMACSEKAGEYLFGKKEMCEDNVVILNNAISIEKYRFSEQKRIKIRNDLGLKDEVVLGHVGRFVEQKNHKQLIKILMHLHKSGWNVKLLLIGEGKLRKEIEKKIEKEQLEDRVIFTGMVDNVDEYLSAMDIFLLPSFYEGLPVVCVEAQAAGLPCLISSNVTKEIGITNYVKFIKCNRTLEWCDEIVEFSKKTINRKNEVVLDDFDIGKQAKKLEEYYISNV